MKATPLLVAWHNDSQPVYSAHFEPHGKGRLATAGGDNNVRLWRVEQNGEDRKVVYLSTLSKHTQAVNVVRWCPKGELLASASDDSNVLLWVPSELGSTAAYGDDTSDDKEHWMVKRICRSNTESEIYDLAWSPDGAFFITGSVDSIARIYDAATGAVVRQIAEHHHYVQGVAWDPLNEFLATQSSDRSVHVYALKQSDGQFTLSQHGKMSKMDMPARRRTSNSPAPPELGHRGRVGSESAGITAQSPGLSAPGTPASLALPMNPPPPTSHSRRSSFTGGASPMTQRSVSPAPSMPLPAVMPGASPRPRATSTARNTNLYANESLTSFFRRLTFAPDGSLLFTPAGQYKKSHPSVNESTSKQADDIINTVYIYSRAGLNKPPVAHLPGHKKASIAVRCSPIMYNLRLPSPTKEITIDTSSKVDDIMPLPEPAMPAMPTKPRSTSTTMDPPPTVPSPAPSQRAMSPRPTTESDTEVRSPGSGPPAGPQSAFALPYRVVYAVATQDAVFIYDTQQQTPLAIVSNLHFATFTDLTWSEDGSTLLISSSDGFCSALSFAPGELGSIYKGSLSMRVGQPSAINTSTSQQSTPVPTPTASGTPHVMKHPSSAGVAPSPSPVSAVRPVSPTRSNSTSSVATQASLQPGHGVVVSNPAPAFSNLPGLTAAASGGVPSISPTPPMTPLHTDSASGAIGSTPTHHSHSHSQSHLQAPLKREGDAPHDEKEPKKRRIAPTLVTSSSTGDPTPKS